MNPELNKLHQMARFISALAHGAEQSLKSGSLSICHVAGKRVGIEAIEGIAVTSDPIKAIEVLRLALEKQGIVWEFEPFQGERAELIEKNGETCRMRLVFHTCMVRSSLFCYAHEQKQSLCHMSHGVFEGAMEKIMPGCSVKLEILHAGPNACLKELIWEEKK